MVEPGSINITIKNGTIEDFLVGINISAANNVIVENVKILITVKTLPDGYFGINIAGSSKVNGGSTGIHFNYSGNCNPESPQQNNGGIVSESTFTDICGLGIIVICSINLNVNNSEYFSNEINNNSVSGCDPDLYHDEGSIGNNWINNTCQIKEGSEFPDCTG